MSGNGAAADRGAVSDALAEADRVLVSVAPNASGDPVLNAFGDELAAAKPQSIVYLSTVGVYGDHGGAWVDETSPCHPKSNRSRQRLDAEARWAGFGAETGVPVAIIRLAGIYGPGRGPFEKLRRGTARRIIKPGQVFNRIHVDDIAAIVEAAFERGASGVFNGSDDEPAPPQDVLAYAAELLGMPPPPEVPFEEAELTPMARSFYGENKRVRNRRIKSELGVRLAYPTYREGLAAVLASEERDAARFVSRSFAGASHSRAKSKKRAARNCKAGRDCRKRFATCLRPNVMAAAIFAAEAFFVLTAGLHVASIVAVAARALLARPPRPCAADAPGVTILRPVCGIENHIEETLASSFRLSYPNYEVIFCCASASDEIVPVVEKLIAAHPEVPARLLIRDDRISVNPKLNNLVKGWAAARARLDRDDGQQHPAPSDYLERLLTCWKPGTGMVCSPPLGSKPEGIGGEVECAFLNTFQARWQIAAASVGLGFAQGKTMLWRREVLDRAGGIQALAAEAAEDAAATKVIRAAGLAIRLTPRPFEQPLGYRSWSEVWRRQVRWARLRRVTFKLFFLPELFSGGFFPLLALAFLSAAGALAPSHALLLAAGWYGMEAILALVLRWRLAALAVFWLIRDLCIPIIWVSAICGNRFEWRGNHMDIRQTDAEGLTPLKIADNGPRA